MFLVASSLFNTKILGFKKNQDQNITRDFRFALEICRCFCENKIPILTIIREYFTSIKRKKIQR